MLLARVYTYILRLSMWSFFLRSIYTHANVFCTESVKSLHLQVWIEGFAGHVWMILTVNLGDGHLDWFPHPTVWTYVLKTFIRFVNAGKRDDLPI